MDYRTPVALGCLAALAACGDSTKPKPPAAEYTIVAPSGRQECRVSTATFYPYVLGALHSERAVYIVLGDSIQFYHELGPAQLPAPGTYTLTGSALTARDLFMVYPKHRLLFPGTIDSLRSRITLEEQTAERSRGRFTLESILGPLPTGRTTITGSFTATRAAEYRIPTGATSCQG